MQLQSQLHLVSKLILSVLELNIVLSVFCNNYDDDEAGGSRSTAAPTDEDPLNCAINRFTLVHYQGQWLRDPQGPDSCSSYCKGKWEDFETELQEDLINWFTNGFNMPISYTWEYNYAPLRNRRRYDPCQISPHICYGYKYTEPMCRSTCANLQNGRACPGHIGSFCHCSIELTFRMMKGPMLVADDGSSCELQDICERLRTDSIFSRMGWHCAGDSGSMRLEAVRCPRENDPLPISDCHCDGGSLDCRRVAVVSYGINGERTPGQTQPFDLNAYDFPRIL